MKNLKAEGLLYFITTYNINLAYEYKKKNSEIYNEKAISMWKNTLREIEIEFQTRELLCEKLMSKVRDKEYQTGFKIYELPEPTKKTASVDSLLKQIKELCYQYTTSNDFPSIDKKIKYIETLIISREKSFIKLSKALCKLYHDGADDTCNGKHVCGPMIWLAVDSERQKPTLPEKEVELILKWLDKTYKNN